MLKYFSSYPRKHDLTFHANCQNGGNLQEMSNTVSGKNKKNITKLSSAEFAQGVVKVNMLCCICFYRRMFVIAKTTGPSCSKLNELLAYVTFKFLP